MKFRNVWLLVLLMISTSMGCGELEVQPLNDQVARAFIHEISGVRAKTYVEAISQYNRTEGGYEDTGYEKAVNYVMSVLEESGVVNY